MIFEKGITTIPSHLFHNCAGLDTIEIPETITKIGDSAFDTCENLISVKMPDTVGVIGEYAFSNCKKLTGIDLPMKVEQLGTGAFLNCEGIKTITIPKTISDVGYSSWDNRSPFTGCVNLKEVIFEKGRTTIPSHLFHNCAGIETIELPEGITMIKDSAFNGCVNLTSIKIPDTVNTIGTSVFSGCSALTELVLPKTMTYISDSLCYGCTSLTSFPYPEAPTKIGSSAFYGCKSLTEVTIPDSVESVGDSAFYNCTGLQSFTAGKNLKTIDAAAFSHDSALTSVELNKGLQQIYGSAFAYCSILENIALPDTLNSIGTHCFEYCELLSDVTFGAGITEIPEYCFYEDPALVKIVLPQQITTIGKYAFANCTKLADITINRNVSSVGENVFSYPDKFTIHGVKSTYAEEYATENEIAFEALEVPATDIKLNYTELKLGVKDTAALRATLVPLDSSDELTWSSTDESVVTVSDTGKVTAVNVGEAAIAVMAGDVMVSCDVTVYQPVTGLDLDMYQYAGTLGDTFTLKATVYPTYAENKNVLWSSDNTEVATVDENGLVTAVGYGKATITAKTEDRNKTRTCEVTIAPISVTGVTLNKTAVTIGVDEQFTLVPTISPANATNKEVTWSSGKTSVVKVENGVITGLAEGKSIIIVKTKDGSKTAACTVTVKNTPVIGVTLDTTEASLRVGKSVQLNAVIAPTDASNQHVTWTTTNASVATVSETGNVTAVTPGQATITVTTEDGSYQASCEVTVIGTKVESVMITPETLDLTVGNAVALKASITPEDADVTDVVWSSSDEAVATVSELGVVKAVAEGNAIIRVTTIDGGKTADCIVAVTAGSEGEEKISVTGIAITESELSLMIGDSHALTTEIIPEDATDKTVSWLSTNPKVVYVDEDGVIVACGTGEADVIVCTKDGGLEAVCHVTVESIPISTLTLVNVPESMKVGQKTQLSVAVAPENATNQTVIWESNAPGVLSVDQTGLITALRAGTATITVSSEDGTAQDSAEITVKAPEPVVQKPGTVKNISAAAAGKNKVKITWGQVSDADGYLIYTKKSGKEYTYCGWVKSKTQTSYTDTKAVDTEYNFYWVYAYKYDANGKRIVGKCERYVYAKGTCVRVENLKASSVKGGVKVSWSKSAGADGYIIYGKTKSGKYGYIGMTSKTTYTDTKASKSEYNFYWVFPYHNSVSGKRAIGPVSAKYVYGKAK